MERTIIAKGKSAGSYFQSADVKIKIVFQGLTKDEIDSKVEHLKDRIHDFLRDAANFHQSEIKIS